MPSCNRRTGRTTRMLESAIRFVMKNHRVAYIVVVNSNHKSATKQALLSLLQDRDIVLPMPFLDYFKFVIYANQRFEGIDPRRIFWDHFTLESIWTG